MECGGTSPCVFTPKTHGALQSGSLFNCTERFDSWVSVLHVELIFRFVQELGNTIGHVPMLSKTRDRSPNIHGKRTNNKYQKKQHLCGVLSISSTETPKDFVLSPQNPPGPGQSSSRSFALGSPGPVPALGAARNSNAPLQSAPHEGHANLTTNSVDSSLTRHRPLGRVISHQLRTDWSGSLGRAWLAGLRSSLAKGEKKVFHPEAA